MAEQTVYTCDECGKVKGETNHWFRALTEGRSIVFTPWDEPIGYPDDKDRPERHLCGHACAIQLLSKTIGQSGRQPRPTTSAAVSVESR